MPLVRPSKRPIDPAVPGGPFTVDEASLKRYPTLLEFLGSDMWPGGDPRETGTITLFLDQGKWKAGLNDRDAERSAYMSADTLQGLWEGIEKALAKDTMDWRPWKKALDKKKRT